MVIDQPRSSSLYKTLRKILATRAGIWLFSPRLHVLDRIFLALTKGRTTLSGILGGAPIVTVTAVGSRTGELRSVPLLAIPHGEGIVLIASNWGRPRHPGWYHNLRASPTVEVTYRKHTATYVVRELKGEERDACWKRATEIYPGYNVYQRRCPSRKIPVVMLSPAQT